MKIYIAAPLFSEGDRAYNDVIYKRIKEVFPDVEIYLPQNNAAINDKTASADSVQIYDGDTEQLLSSDILVALLDGVCIDNGVASEVGFIAGWNEASPNKKIILGLFTDNRDFSITSSASKIADSVSGLAESQFPYRNLYTIGCCKKYGTIVNTIDKLIKEINDYGKSSLLRNTSNRV